jgi:hypothetical protein
LGGSGSGHGLTGEWNWVWMDWDGWAQFGFLDPVKSELDWWSNVYDCIVYLLVDHVCDFDQKFCEFLFPQT